MHMYRLFFAKIAKMLALSNRCSYNKGMNGIVCDLSIMEKLEILADAAKYDVACTSSGVDRRGKEGALGNACASGICHSFSADGRCISLLKVLMTNHCVYDCKYCRNRASNDVKRAIFSPDELCRLVIEFYKRNYIEGLFLSSGVYQNPAITMEKMVESLELLRTEYHFNGYIHVKAIPGAPDELLAAAGYLADRISINLELPTAQSLALLAPNKSFQTILTPMNKVAGTIKEHRLAIGKSSLFERSASNKHLKNSIFNQKKIGADKEPLIDTKKEAKLTASSNGELGWDCARQVLRHDGLQLKRAFAPAGQSTQMIIGATGESDYNLICATQMLYQSYDLRRVFFSGYVPLNEDAVLPSVDTPVPLLREHRLYQADWLLRYYGFQADELLSQEQPNFNEKLDPKCDWALRHLDVFPVEVETAAYDLLLRIPGIGPKSAYRILQARRYGHLTFDALKRMGVVLKRAHYFITCGGKMMYSVKLEKQFITRQLTATNQKENWEIVHRNHYQQLSLFDDFGLAGGQT